MSFYMYDIGFLVLFTLFVVIFLYQRRKNLKKEGLMYLYRTKVGVRFIDYVGEKYKKTLSVFGFLGVVSGYILMVSMLYFLYKLVYVYIFSPDIVRMIKVPPVMPILPYFDKMFSISFLPPFYFTYWIVAIAVIAIFHEFSHGIIARRYGVHIKATGFGFLGPFLAAFVDPDEKQMIKKSKYQQIAILSSGTFANVILTIIFFVLLIGFFNFAYAPAGAEFNSYVTGKVNLTSIKSINGIPVYDNTETGIIKFLEENKINNTIILGTGNSSINMIKINTANRTYYISMEVLKQQLEQNLSYALLYMNMPAINAGMKGVIVQIDDTQVAKYADLAEVMKKYSPGDKIVIKTKLDGKEINYDLVLAEDPSQAGRPMIGIGFSGGSQKTGIISRIYNLINMFKEPATFYEPKFNAEFVIFIYNLIWWLALINLSVALMNMLPMGIFDGGRMFMLTIWGITGSKRAGEIAFKAVTYIILGALVVLMGGWIIAMF